MRSDEPRRGIERRILTSILVVGILPMALVVVAGYLLARVGQMDAAARELADAAETRAWVIRLALGTQWKHIDQLSQNPEVGRLIAAASREETEGGTVDSAREALRQMLVREKEHVQDGVAVTAYDAEGEVLASAGVEDTLGRRARARLLEFRGPGFLDVDYVPEQRQYNAVVASPVGGTGTDSPAGFLAITFTLDNLLRFVFGPGPASNSRQADGNVFQIVYEGGEELRVAYLASDVPFGHAVRPMPMDPRLARAIEQRPVPTGPLTLGEYTSAAGGPIDVLLTYRPIFEQGSYYIVAYRPRGSVFSLLNRAAVAGILSCTALVGFLCFRAYRNVHNNIVRPVMLLNEGAQIIGQGDLELKLKIGTGDEIEELATSFNKMALALKRNIRRLEESEERYRSLVTSMRDGIYQTDLSGALSYLNPAGVEIFGYTQYEEILGQKLRAFFLSEPEYGHFMAELDAKGFVERSRIWMKRRDGRSICVELSGNVAYSDDGVMEGFEGTFRDVTKSVRLEQEARERSERLNAINQIANVINSSLEAGRLYESLVVEVKKLVDFDYASLSLWSDEGQCFHTRQLWPEVERRGEAPTYRIDGRGSCAAGVAEKRECLIIEDLEADPCHENEFTRDTRSCLCVPLYATGRIIGTLNLGARRRQAFSERDVEVLEQMAPHVAVAIRNAHLLDNLQQSLQEVTRAREELHAANEELKTLDEMKTNLLSNVSHELRTPLVSVMGYTDMIYNGKVGPINETQKDYLSISLRNIEKLVTLIENLLDFSRLHRGAEQLVFDTFDLVDCARGAVQLIKPVADEHGITVELKAPDELVLVEGDKGKIGQVFTNLLSNAVKFSPDGGVVTLELQTTQDSVEASVTDRGIGIPPEALDKIFTRFYQYDSSSTRKYGGTGIGLSIAQDIARLHGSRITVASEMDKGSTFAFTLPLCATREDREDAARTLLPPMTQVLIELVTHDRALSAEVRNCLMPEGMDVIQAVNVEQAVALAERHSPDCVVIDTELRGNGKSSLDALLENPATSRLPIILLTNEPEAYDRYRTLVASRIKRGFRKSTLLSGIGYALNPGGPGAESLGRKVLCVDDDPEILIFIRRLLEGEGLEIEQCASGAEALEKVATREFGVVLLDIAMPGMDGWEACRRIKSDPALRGIRVYMVTAKPIDPQAPRTQEAAADGVLLKPFKAEDLIDLVRGGQAAGAVPDS